MSFRQPKHPLTASDLGIKAASIAACAVAIPTFLASLLLLINGKGLFTLTISVIMLICIYFLYFRKSRIAVLAIFLWFAVNQVRIFIINPNAINNLQRSSIALNAVFLIALIFGIIGTISYQRQKDNIE